MGRARSTERKLTGPARAGARPPEAPAAENGGVGADLPEAIDGLDRTIHEKARLAIVSVLASAGEVTFSELRELTKLTDGNLSVHARVLENAGHIKVRKGFQGRRPRTTYALTERGLRAFRDYVDALEQIVLNVRGRPRTGGEGDGEGGGERSSGRDAR